MISALLVEKMYQLNLVEVVVGMFVGLFVKKKKTFGLQNEKR